MFRLQQTVCRVSWKNGMPFIETGKVSRVTSQTFDVSCGETTHRCRDGWFGEWPTAIDAELKYFMSAFDPLMGWARGNETWNPSRIMRVLIKIWRLQRKIVDRDSTIRLLRKAKESA